MQFIYTEKGDPVGFVHGAFIHDMHGKAIGQISGSHVYKLAGHYVGELFKDMVINKGLANPGDLGNHGDPGNPGPPPNPGKRGYVGVAHPDVFHLLLT